MAVGRDPTAAVRSDCYTALWPARLDHTEVQRMCSSHSYFPSSWGGYANYLLLPSIVPSLPERYLKESTYMATYCKTQAQANAEMDEWIKTSVGKQFLGPYLAQCARYSQETAMAYFQAARYVGHGYGNAIDIIENCDKNYFDVIWNDPNNASLIPRRGDLIIWEGSALWDGQKYGHIAVVASATQSAVTVVQQDGAASPTQKVGNYYYSVKPAHVATLPYFGPGTVGAVRGWIRPKWQKVAYSGADKRGYGNGVVKEVAKKAAASTAQSFTYSLDNNPSSNYYTPTEVLTNYKQPRKVLGVTIHWWNDPKNAGTHDGTAAYLARKGGDTSAHYVVSPGRVTRLVDDKNAAWHAGNATGNATTIGIECNPHDVEGTLPTVAALIRDLEKKHGDLKIYRHRDWRSTTCPGTYSNRIDKLVNLVNSAPTKSEETLEEWIVSNEDKVRKMIEDSVNKAVNSAFSKKIPGRGQAKGDMTVLDHLAWSRDHRAQEIARRAEVDEKLASLAKGINAALDRLDEHDKTEGN